MKVVMASFGSYGDIAPFLWMGKALKQRGHRVVLLANPLFRDVILGHEIEFCAIGTEEEYRLAATPAKHTGSRFRDQGEQINASRRLYNNMFLNPSKPTCDIILSLREGVEPMLILGHFFAYGARLAAERLGLPYVNVCLSPYWLRSFQCVDSLKRWKARLSCRVNTSFIDSQLFHKPFGALRSQLGLPALKGSSVQWMFSSHNLCLYPRWFQSFEHAGIRADYAGFPGPLEGNTLPPEVDDFLKSHDKPVVFTPGSSAGDVGNFFSHALQAVEKLGIPAIFLSRSSNGLPSDLPGTVLHASFIPLEALLSRSAALVHHGGIGSASRAMEAGIPQVICYRTAEQLENARQAVATGTACMISVEQCNAGTLTAALAGLLHNAQVGGCCTALQNRVNGDSPEKLLVDSLSQFGV